MRQRRIEHIVLEALCREGWIGLHIEQFAGYLYGQEGNWRN
jgi:hypothetical protein